MDAIPTTDVAPDAVAADAAARAFLKAFTEAWRQPIDADHFADRFDPWLDPDVRMVQPQIPPISGRRAFRERFVRPLFELIPDLRGTVQGWAINGDTLYVELRLSGTIGSRTVTLRSCDRVTLRDGRVVERVAHLDPTALVAAVVRAPRLWTRLLRQRIAAGRESR